MAAIQQTDPKTYYSSWFRETLASVEQIQRPLEGGAPFPLEKVRDIAKDFSLMITPPPKLHQTLYTVALEEGLLDELNKASTFFQSFRESLPDCSTKRALEWFSFTPLTPQGWTQKLSSFPFIMKQRQFKIVEVGGGKLQVYWKHLMTCLCSAASPGGIDKLAVTIATQLEGHKEAVLVDFGSGGCLPALPIISRLTHMNRIILYLVDPIYTAKAHRVYLVKTHQIASKDGKPPLTDTKINLAVSELLGKCAQYLPQGCTLYVYVVGNIAQVPITLPKVPHVLFTVDPEPDAAADFRTSVQLLENTENPSYYCLNEIVGVNGKLTKEEALDTDRIFSRISAPAEKKEEGKTK